MSTKRSGWRGKLLASLMVVLAASVAHADIINVGSGDWTGSRSSSAGGGLDDGTWSGTITLEWTITYDAQSDEFTYEYVVSGTGSPAISHFDIEVSPNFDEDDILDGTETGLGEGVTLGDPSWDDEGNDAPVFKFDWGEGDDGDGQGTPWEVTYTLVTGKRPVWGDVLGKAGRDDLFVNTGFDTDPASGTTDFTDWVPTPDSVNMVPLPPAAWMGLGLLGVLGLAHRRRQRRDS